MALMVQIGQDEDPLELEQAIRLARARLAVSAIRRESQKRRDLSMGDIDKEIKAVRTERKDRLAHL